MGKAFKDTCNYTKCENKDDCVRYSEQGAYNLELLCARKDYKWMIKKETELVVNESKTN